MRRRPWLLLRLPALLLAALVAARLLGGMVPALRSPSAYAGGGGAGDAAVAVAVAGAGAGAGAGAARTRDDGPQDEPEVDGAEEGDVPRFRPADLDVGGSVPCGKKKCMFPLRSDPGTGYLVAAEAGERRLDRARLAWRYASHLERTYGASHLFLGPPAEEELDAAQAARLNGADLSRLEVNGRASGSLPRFGEGAVLVQRVRVAPDPSLLVGCGRKYDHAAERLDAFVGTVPDPGRFALTLGRTANVTRDVLRYPGNRCLFRDFQVMLDADGNLYQLDLDRCPLDRKYEDGFEGRMRDCLAQFDKFVDGCIRKAKVRAGRGGGGGGETAARRRRRA